MAFDAYAVSADLDDPLNKVLVALGTRTEDIDGRARGNPAPPGRVGGRDRHARTPPHRERRPGSG